MDPETGFRYVKFEISISTLNEISDLKNYL